MVSEKIKKSLTKRKKYDRIHCRKPARRCLYLWDEMSYRKFTQSGKDTLPDVWDNIDNSLEEQMAQWIYENGTFIFEPEME